MDNPPERSAGDTVHAVVKSIASAVSTAGGPLSVLLETLFAPPIERRKEKWFKQLAEVVSQLEQRVADLTAEKLSQNELFVTVALQATQIALRNHQDEKLSALRGAVLHAGLPHGPDEQLQLMFLQFVDELTPSHLAMLALLNGPVLWMEQHNITYPGWGMGGVSTVVEHCFPGSSWSARGLRTNRPRPADAWAFSSRSISQRHHDRQRYGGVSYYRDWKSLHCLRVGRFIAAQPIIPPDLCEKPHRPVNSNA